MSADVVNRVPYIQTTRSYQKDSPDLVKDLEDSYQDTANAVNERTIGIYPTFKPAITGNTFYLSGNQRVQTLRQVFTISGVGNIDHNLNFGTAFENIAGIAAIYGTFFEDSTGNWYSLPYVDETAANNQISVTITPTQIQVAAGAGSPPTITSGFVIIEWLGFAIKTDV